LTFSATERIRSLPLQVPFSCVFHGLLFSSERKEEEEEEEEEEETEEKTEVSAKEECEGWCG